MNILKYTFLISFIFIVDIFSQVQQQWVLSSLNYECIFLNADLTGNIYITGYISGMDSPEFTTLQKISPGGTEIYTTRIDTPCFPSGAYMDNLYNQYIAGAYSGGWAPARFTVAKISPSGIVIWQKHDSFSYGDNMVGICGDKAGNSFVLKYKNGQNYIIKYDSAGNVQNSIIVSDTITAREIEQDNLGNIIISGFITINSTCNAIVIKYSPSLVKLWKANYMRPGGTMINYFFKTKTTLSQNIYCLVDSYILVNHDAYTLIKYNSSGVQQWVGYYDSSFSGIPSSMILDSLENIYLAGSAGTIKINSSGIQLWSDTCPNIGGVTLDRYLNVYSSGSLGNTTIRSVKISPLGTRLWSVNYSHYPSLVSGALIITDTARNVIISGNEWAPMLYNESITVKYNQILGIKNISNFSPIKFELSQNYPNPFNPSTKIKFDTPRNPPEGGTYIRLIIYDILGREVATLVNEKLEPGTYEVKWDGSNYPSGIYFYKMETDNATAPLSITKKMVLLK